MDLLTPGINNNNSKGVSWYRGCLIAIGLAVLGFAVSGIVGYILIKGDASALTNPENADMIRLIQAISVIFTMFLPALLVEMPSEGD